MKTVLFIVVLTVVIIVDFDAASAQTRAASSSQVAQQPVVTDQPTLAQTQATSRVTQGQPKDVDSLEKGLAEMCRSANAVFAWWDRQTQTCVAIDFSSDQVYEPN